MPPCRDPAQTPLWAAIIEFFSVCPPFRRKSVLSINQFSEFARDVGRQSVLSNIRLLRNSFRLAVAFKFGRPCARSEVVGPGESEAASCPPRRGGPIHSEPEGRIMWAAVTAWPRMCTQGFTRAYPFVPRALPSDIYCVVRHTTIFVILVLNSHDYLFIAPIYL